jgi:hypothetical protein
MRETVNAQAPVQLITAPIETPTPAPAQTEELVAVA